MYLGCVCVYFCAVAVGVRTELETFQILRMKCIAIECVCVRESELWGSWKFRNQIENHNWFFEFNKRANVDRVQQKEYHHDHRQQQEQATKWQQLNVKQQKCIIVCISKYLRDPWPSYRSLCVLKTAGLFRLSFSLDGRTQQQQKTNHSEFKNTTMEFSLSKQTQVKSNATKV